MSAETAILIVEHDQSTRELYQRTLSAAYHVVAASATLQLSQLIHQHRIQAVVIEPGPFGTSTWAALANLKHNPTTADIPIIICTTQDERRQGLLLGVAAYLIKPVLPEALLAAIRSSLAQKHSNS